MSKDKRQTKNEKKETSSFILEYERVGRELFAVRCILNKNNLGQLGFDWEFGNRSKGKGLEMEDAFCVTKTRMRHMCD